MKLNLSFFILLFITSIASAEELPGKPDSIFSTVLNEKRILQVYLPKNYKPASKEKYDVLYLLDGDSNIKLFSQILEFVMYQKYTPGLIVVAITNTDRNRDFLPTHTKNLKSSGGAANFLSFIKQELIPYINKTYPSSGENLLYGHSFGGTFTMFALLNEPDLFTSCIMADPSFWYDDNLLCKLATAKLKNLKGMEKLVYITGREDGMKEMGIDKMDSVLKAQAPTDLLYKVVSYEDETHSSVRFKSMYDGLKFSYSGYKIKNARIEFHPENGIVLKDKPYKLYNVSGLKGLRYTVDGTPANLQSAGFGEKLDLTGAAKLYVKNFTPRGRYDKSTTGSFTLGVAPEPVRKTAKFIPGGLSYSYYEGSWSSIPVFKKLKPMQSGIADHDFNFGKLPSKINFACVFDGLIEIKDEGYYVLCTNADDGSKLYLNNKLLIDYVAINGERSLHSFLIPLKKGFYPIRLEYLQKEGNYDLKLSYILPGGNEPVDVPYELLYSKR